MSESGTRSPPTRTETSVGDLTRSLATAENLGFCPPGQTVAFVSVSYSNIVITDLTSGATTMFKGTFTYANRTRLPFGGSEFHQRNPASARSRRGSSLVRRRSQRQRSYPTAPYPSAWWTSEPADDTHCAGGGTVSHRTGAIRLRSFGRSRCPPALGTLACPGRYRRSDRATRIPDPPDVPHPGPSTPGPRSERRSVAHGHG